MIPSARSAKGWRRRFGRHWWCRGRVLRPHQRVQDSLGGAALRCISFVDLPLGDREFPNHRPWDNGCARNVSGQGAGPPSASHRSASNAPTTNLLPVRLLSAHSAEICSPSTWCSRILVDHVATSVPASLRQLRPQPTTPCPSRRRRDAPAGPPTRGCAGAATARSPPTGHRSATSHRRGHPVAEIHHQVADLLNGPSAVGVRRRANQVHRPAADLHHELHKIRLSVTAQSTSKVTRQHRRCLGAQELPPGRVGAADRCRWYLQHKLEKDQI